MAQFDMLLLLLAVREPNRRSRRCLAQAGAPLGLLAFYRLRDVERIDALSAGGR
jgi:hypothetical protein